MEVNRAIGRAALAQAVVVALAFCGAAVAQSRPQATVNGISQAQARVVTVNIPAQSLASALVAFATQTGLQIVYANPKRLVGLTSPGFHGKGTVNNVLDELLRTSRLTYAFVNARTVTVHARRAAALDPAQAVSSPPPTSTTNQRDSSGNRTSQHQKKPAELKTVVVTGTLALGRTAVASLAPIDVLTPEDLRSTGATDLVTALRTLLPSLNFPQPDVDDATTASQPAQLRGLAPDETMVLINGKRMHTTATLNVTEAIGRGSSPVDLSAIPMNAIQRIEVLRDGAASQYGSGAIAGVINIILKGGRGGHGSANVSYGHHNGQVGGTLHGGADTGFNLGSSGWAHVSLNYVNQSPSNTAGPDLRFPGDPAFGTVDFRIGLPDTIARQAAINMQYSFSKDAVLYAYTLFNKRNVDAFGFFRPRAKMPEAAQEIFPNGFLPAEHSTLRDDNTVIGMKGHVLGWHYDISGDTGGNHWKMFMSNDLNYALGVNSPTTFYIGTLTNRQNEINLDFRRPFDVGLYDDITVAWGLAYRHAKFTIKPGDVTSYIGSGSQAFAGFQPSDSGTHSRDNMAEYVDVAADFTEAFSVEAAGRHEHYSDFGSAYVWKASGRYGFSDAVGMRGTISTGFRAPSLQQEYYSSTSTQFDENHDLVTTHTFPVSDPAAAALGALPLRPEKSRNYSVGLVLTPFVGPYTTIDAYEIKIRNRILLSADLSGPLVESYLTSVGFPGVLGGNFFTNAVDTKTRGLDIVSTWPISLRTSQLKLTGGFNYNWTEITHIRPNPPQLALHGLVLPVAGRRERSLITTAIPRTKVFVASDWSTGHWTLRARATRYGKWRFSNTSDPSGDQTFKSKALLDLSASYHLGRLDFTLGGNNVTNVRPTKNNPALNFGGILTYPKTSPFGLGGSYWYGTVAYSW